MINFVLYSVIPSGVEGPRVCRCGEEVEGSFPTNPIRESAW